MYVCGYPLIDAFTPELPTGAVLEFACIYWDEQINLD